MLLRDLQLDPVVREQAILRVAALTPGAEYEWVQHEAIGRAVGMTDAQIEACRSGEPNDLVLRFTEEVVRDATPERCDVRRDLRAPLARARSSS